MRLIIGTIAIITVLFSTVLSSALGVSTSAHAAAAIAYCNGTEYFGVGSGATVAEATATARAICVRKGGTNECCKIRTFSPRTADGPEVCLALAIRNSGGYNTGFGATPNEAAGQAILRCGPECSITAATENCN